MWKTPEKAPASTFAQDLCEMMVSCDIPLYKLRSDKLRGFLDKYTTEAVPCETTLRNSYVPQMLTTLIDKIKDQVKDQFVWVSIDETTDSLKNKVINVVMGILSNDPEKAKKKFLLDVTIALDTVDNEIIVRAYEKAIAKLGSDFNKNSVLLFLTDAAPYIVLASKTLKILYPKLLHVTCIVHGLHRVCEKIRDENDEVNDLISNMKTLFVKSHKRAQLFKETNPGVPLPPQPVITRWGTWLDAGMYYFKYWKETNNILSCC